MIELKTKHQWFPLWPGQDRRARERKAARVFAGLQVAECPNEFPPSRREVLFVDAKFQSLLAIFVERKKIKIVVGAAMQDPALKINGGVNEGVEFAAIFGLNVKGSVTSLAFELWPKTIRSLP